MAFKPRLMSLWIILTLFSERVISTNACFFPNGDTAKSYVPCSPNGDGGCCADGDFCTSLGYCISNSKGYHYRGACTDPAWGNPSCPDYCLANTNSGNSSAVNVIACNAASTSGSWCCAYNGNCCSSSTFTPSFGTVFAEPGSSSTSSASSSSTSISSSSSSTSSSSASPASASPTSSSTTLTSQNTTTASTGNGSGNNKNGSIVGASVGVPLGLLALAGLFLYYRERNKRKRIQNEIPEKNTADFPAFSHPNSYNNESHGQAGYGPLGNEEGRLNKPVMTSYEMDSQREVELPAMHGRTEVAAVPGYNYAQHGQQGTFREGM